MTEVDEPTAGISAMINRMVDTEKEIDRGEMRNPLAGLFPSTLLQKSIEEALMPLFVAAIILHIPQTIEIARAKLKKMNKKGLFPHINDDQKLSIIIYTMESQPKEVSVREKFCLNHAEEFLISILLSGILQS